MHHNHLSLSPVRLQQVRLQTTLAYFGPCFTSLYHRSLLHVRTTPTTFDDATAPLTALPLLNCTARQQPRPSRAPQQEHPHCQPPLSTPTYHTLSSAMPIMIYLYLCQLHQLPILQWTIIQMSKEGRKGSHRRHPSADCRNAEGSYLQKKNSGAEGESRHLVELKDRGLKVLNRLLHNEPINKLKKLVQLGADSLKKEILPAHKLLPKLTTTDIISELVQQPEASKFQQMDRELTSSMLFFQQQLHPNLENSQMGEIIRAQTDKCYQHIPNSYFQPELAPPTLNALLSRDKAATLAASDELTDYYDEVEFNVNQQVNYKMRIFMNFVSYLGSIGKMADLSIQKIHGSRAKNIVVKEIVVKRAERVNQLRQRKEEIERCIKVLDKLKKLKKMEDWFMSQVQAKGKITVLSLYPEYCTIHAELKGYCCPRLLCKYWDVTYYIERGYQDSFSRSLKNYLGQIIALDEKQLKEIVSPNKNLFATVQDCRHIASLSDPALKLDESFEVEEEEVELVSKHNIQREIVNNFKQGLLKCSYSTDEICQEVREAIEHCEKQMYLIARADPSKEISGQLTPADRKQALEKLTMTRYVRVVEHWSDRMRKAMKRQFSIIERALRACFQLQMDHPEKYEITTSYLMQVIYVSLAAVDESMAQLLASKKFKPQEADHLRQVLLYQQHWEELILDTRHSPQLWNQFETRFLGDQSPEDPKEKESLIAEGLLTALSAERLRILELMINGYNCSSLQKLAGYLQEETWKPASIPSRFSRMFGEVLYGPPFKEDLDRIELKMLSSSLLLEKNSSSCLGHSQTELEFREDNSIITSDQIPSSYPFHVGESIVTLEGQRFKLLQSTMQVVESIQGYLEWVEECSKKQKLQSNILSKISEFFCVYNNHVKDLILNKAALNYGKIKSKSITGKHLLIAYSQLKLVKKIALMIAKRTPKFEESVGNIRERFDKNMTDISKKFRLVLELAIRECINKLVVDPRTQIAWPVPESKEIVNALHRSCDYIRDILMGEEELGHFISVQWSDLYLQKVRSQYRSVYKQIMNSNGTRKSKDIDWSDNIYWKFKELEYMVQNLAEVRENIPGFQSIIEELEQERKKVERPH